MVGGGKRSQYHRMDKNNLSSMWGKGAAKKRTKQHRTVDAYPVYINYRRRLRDANQGAVI